MNIICFLKGHLLADRSRIPPIPHRPAPLVPLEYTIQDYCRRCGAVDDELSGYNLGQFRDFDWPKLRARVLRKLGYCRIEEACDYLYTLGRFQLFVWKIDEFQTPNLKEWGIGRRAGDGSFAIRTPWFLLYLE